MRGKGMHGVNSVRIIVLGFAAILLTLGIFPVSSFSEVRSDLELSDGIDSRFTGSDAGGFIEVTPDSGIVHNPFGTVLADVEAWTHSKLVRAVRLWTEGEPDEILIRLEPSVVFFQGDIRSTMTIHGRMAAGETYTFRVVAEWTDIWGFKWREIAPYTLRIVEDFDIHDLRSWNENPYLDRETGLWEARTFCWTIGGGCDILPEPNTAEWLEDGDVLLYA